MRSIRTYVWLPALCAVALLQACGSSTSSGGDGTSSAGAPVSGTAGAATAGAAPVTTGGATGIAGTPSASGGDTSSAGTPGAGGSSGDATAGAPSGGASAGGTSTGGTSGSGTSGAGGGGTVTLKPIGKYTLSWYTFQDNTPVNSLFSASGHILVPFVSVAVPFTQLANCVGITPPKGKTCGTLKYGDKLYVDFLKDRVMPNGMKHTGWVMIDDFCGDRNDDTYCYLQADDGKTYPNVDLYIGDFVKSGMKPDANGCGGPAGDGSQAVNVSTGTPGALFIMSYGGAAIGTGKCGDRQTARDQQYGPKKGTPFGTGAANDPTTACWGYDGQTDTDCSMCTAMTCAP